MGLKELQQIPEVLTGALTTVEIPASGRIPGEALLLVGYILLPHKVAPCQWPFPRHAASSFAIRRAQRKRFVKRVTITATPLRKWDKIDP